MNVKNLKCLEIGMSRAAGAIRVVRSRSRPLVAQRKALTRQYRYGEKTPWGVIEQCVTHTHLCEIVCDRTTQTSRANNSMHLFFSILNK